MTGGSCKRKQKNVVRIIESKGTGTDPKTMTHMRMTDQGRTAQVGNKTSQKQICF